MEVQTYDIAGVTLLTPRHIGDERGYFAETFRADLFAKHIGDYMFVQDNESMSARVGTIRGLHFQSNPHAQGKLVRCTAGALYDVAVDIRVGSPTYGQWAGETLTPDNGKQLWVPPGFAHGFCTLEPNTVIAYKVTGGYYNTECDKGLAWDDPAIGIVWPDAADADTLSAKDRKQPLLTDLPAYFNWSK
ncbi:dTDP-4-dehydrorhamnose 3,5-epimerase [Sphingobium sp. Ant17]|uniref:dTDP-4-dehydrorhamnose 3,5-epimerase n=1 Tax=Sphingobium sp. Ant17 TaxID=1461752 RepID=UPI00044E9469|nr:dTDP-4-dehydrorhamnose 3,5-epimerase [Sphingobium sp. Ant17]EXS68686.1 dTDP-4-dehydrorhamnose 3,5-epimerase [Sphingobium sp. Ant17]OHC90656.1 MAG: dTDP-4-dehydrorhamnose 3,5-epimerase [Sphingomonadales bacterium GWF1_63_6]OHD01920.1 MAG: dTDP-4-dehydrorhamnose 3,5-epimerase [Sphingomonadales bacterium RIFCSPLOWO2_12_FULL_63_15]|tara:strand:- start:15477 stop:16043 length:567 start_codon:yes stop_codon:yes gene_type:complete